MKTLEALGCKYLFGTYSNISHFIIKKQMLKADTFKYIRPITLQVSIAKELMDRKFKNNKKEE